MSGFCEHCGTGPDCAVCGRSDPTCERCDGTVTEYVTTPVVGRELLCGPCAGAMLTAREKWTKALADLADEYLAEPERIEAARLRFANAIGASQ